MTDIELTEHGSRLSLPLSDALGRALIESRLVEAKRDPSHAGHWLVKAKGIVGVARVIVDDGEAVTIRIAPKVPIVRLLFLLGYALNPKGWRDEDVTLDEEPGLVAAFARLFAVQAERALRPGLLQGYRATEEAALVVRGRVREAEQIRRHYGRFPPLEIVHDEFTMDIPENRLLRAACERLDRLPSTISGAVPAAVRSRLLQLRLRLADVPSIERWDVLPVWQPTRLNARYHNALRLAELVLRGASVEHRPGNIVVTGFMFNMFQVFEDFVTVALREVLTSSGGRCVLQAPLYLDERETIRMKPDLVHYAGDRTPLVVADAKYKKESRGGFPDADLYQMLAYCTALGLDQGHLVYAKGNAPHTAHRVRHAGITIHQHTLDLRLSPDGLLAEIRNLARRFTAA